MDKDVGQRGLIPDTGETGDQICEIVTALCRLSRDCRDALGLHTLRRKSAFSTELTNFASAFAIPGFAVSRQKDTLVRNGPFEAILQGEYRLSAA